MTHLTTVLDDLKRRFAARAGSDLTRLRSLQDDPERQEDLRLIVHRLAGSAGFFGYGAIGDLANEVDAQLADNVPTKTLPALLQALEELVLAAQSAS